MIGFLVGEAAFLGSTVFVTHKVPLKLGNDNPVLRRNVHVRDAVLVVTQTVLIEVLVHVVGGEVDDRLGLVQRGGQHEAPYLVVHIFLAIAAQLSELLHGR